MSKEYLGSDLSIIIITYNRQKLLDGLLNNLTQLDIMPGEIVVVDNNSTDKTKSIVDQFTDKLPIKYVVEKKQGVSFARNTGVDNSTKEIICFVDDDCRPEKNWTKNILDDFNTFDELSIVGGPVVSIPLVEKKPSLLKRFLHDLYCP